MKCFLLYTLPLYFFISSTCINAPVASIAQEIPAFPGAEGFGSTTPGGRGGRVIEVTNLNESGPGSFRAACEATGPRVVVFRTGGIPSLQLPVRLHLVMEF